MYGIVDDGTGGKVNKDEDEDLDLDRTYDMESTEELCGPREDGEYVPGKNNNLPPFSDSKSFRIKTRPPGFRRSRRVRRRTDNRRRSRPYRKER